MRPLSFTEQIERLNRETAALNAAAAKSRRQLALANAAAEIERYARDNGVPYSTAYRVVGRSETYRAIMDDATTKADQPAEPDQPAKPTASEQDELDAEIRAFAREHAVPYGIAYRAVMRERG